MRVKVAECAALFWDDGKLVWDDYVGHRQYALTEDSESVLRWFSTWRDLESAQELGDRARAIAGRLLDAGALVAEGSDEHLAEERLLARWGVWGSAARHFHFAARTPSGTRYPSLADDAATMFERARGASPPPVAKTHPERPVVALEGAGDAPPEGLLETLYARRSTRQFSPDPVSLAELGTVLQVAGGIVDSENNAAGTAIYKTSPSAGAIHPVELYVVARDVDGLEPGVYHYAPTRGGLEALDRAVADDAAMLGGQPWLAEAPALIVYTAVIGRTQWRYETGRAYRDVLIGLGHVSQTVLLTAASMGLGSVFATAVSDEDLERLVGCDPVEELVLGVAALGRGGMNRGRDFALLWTGQAVSQLGSRTYGVAYMLWVLAATGSPLQTGLIATATLAAFTLATLPAGWLADRFDRRRVMMAADAASATAALSLCAVAALGAFRIDVLIAAAVVLGCGWAVRGTAEHAALPHVVADDDLAAAGSLVEGRAYGAGIAGPPLAGGLFAASPALPFLADGISYLVALGCTASVRGSLGPDPEPADTDADADAGGMREGLRALWSEPFIRTTAVLDAAMIFAVNALGLVVITMLRDMGAGAGSIGLVLGIGSAAGLLGAGLASLATRGRDASRLVLVAAPALGAAAVVGVAAGGTTAALAGAYGAFFVLQPAWSGVLTAEWLRRVDDRRRGRLFGAVSLVTAVPLAAAPLTTGVLLTTLGPRATCIGLASLLAGVALTAAASQATRAPRAAPVAA